MGNGKPQTTMKERDLFKHGWIRGKRKDGGIDWLYPGDMQPRTFQDAVEITVNAYPEVYRNNRT